jgi:hypothetical protein
MSVESYAHKAAKAVVVGWLREGAAEAGGWDQYANVAGISWRVNRGAPHFGVWEEYPLIMRGDGHYTAWDEVSQKYEGRPPSYEELIEKNTRPSVIVDIAIQHKGQISACIEIAHKHPLSPIKLMRLSEMGMYDVLEIPARWVLAQVGRPKLIPPQFWALGRPLIES